MTLYNDIIDGDQFHADEIQDAGPALNAVRYINVNYEAAAKRNIGYIQENIAREKAYQEKRLEKQLDDEIDARLAEIDAEV